MTWSESFHAYIVKRFGAGAQLKAALSLGIGPSKVHYWCHGSRARDAERKRIARWSKGAVKSDLPNAEARSA